MAERSKALDWNSSNIFTGVRGFESHPLRHRNERGPSQVCPLQWLVTEPFGAGACQGANPASAVRRGCFRHACGAGTEARPRRVDQADLQELPEAERAYRRRGCPAARQHRAIARSGRVWVRSSQIVCREDSRAGASINRPCARRNRSSSRDFSRLCMAFFCAGHSHFPCFYGGMTLIPRHLTERLVSALHMSCTTYAVGRVRASRRPWSRTCSRQRSCWAPATADAGVGQTSCLPPPPLTGCSRQARASACCAVDSSAAARRYRASSSAAESGLESRKP